MASKGPITTPLTTLLGIQHPVVLAGMARVSGGLLAAAVSNAGGLGLVGGGYGDPDWVRTQLALVQAETERPWGVGLITWYITPNTMSVKRVTPMPISTFDR